MVHRKALLILTGFLPIMLSGQKSTIKIIADLDTPYDFASSIAIQEDNKVVVAGDAYGRPCMIRFDTTGNLDHAFGQEGKVFTAWDCGCNPCKTDIKMQEDGKIVLGTRFHNGLDTDFLLARFYPDGTPDMTFGENGTVVTQIGPSDDWCNCIAVQQDGKILAGGASETGPGSDDGCRFVLARYNQDGTPDTSFGVNGIVTTRIGQKYNVAHSVEIQPDGMILLAGEANDSIFNDFAVARYHPDGSMDHSFGDLGIVRTEISPFYDYVNSMKLQNDGEILLGGTAEDESMNNNFAMARYHPDGSLDVSFADQGIAITDIGNDYGMAMLIDTLNAKILFTGSSTTGTLYDFTTLRFHLNGLPDSTFGVNGVLTTSFGTWDDEATSIALKPDGEVIIAGYSNLSKSVDFNFAVARLFSSLDISVIDTTIIEPTGTPPVTDRSTDIIVYPNPADNELVVQYSLEREQEIEITLMDIGGREIQRIVNNQPRAPGIHSEKYTLAETLVPGYYWLEIRAGDSRRTVKICKL
jgi:uncharacterized delta-60 repeat protein